MRPIDGDSLLDKVLRHYTEQEKKGNLSFVACEIKQSFADMVNEAPTIEPQRWIHASEPPKESGEYIVMILCGRKPITMQYSVENDAWFDYSDDADEDPIIYYHVTHWMPLPEAPKED